MTKDSMFAFEPGRFKVCDKKLATIGGWTVIEAGLEEGDVIATSGVFHLKSMLLKSSLGEGHGH